VLHFGPNLLTFSINEDIMRIDLFSVLDKRQGLGTRLVASAMDHALVTRTRAISVVTECENATSWGLLLRAGFRVARFLSVFHFVALESP
jgi:hypothetical protein